MFESKVIMTRKEYDELTNEIIKMKNEKEDLIKKIFSTCVSLNAETMTCLLGWEDVEKMFPEEAKMHEEKTIKKESEEYFKNV